MRSLIAGGFLLCAPAVAASTLSMGVEANVREGALDVLDLGRHYGVTTVTEKIGFRQEQITRGLSAEAVVNFTQPDYGSVLVRDANGVEAPLSSRVGSRTEAAADLTVDWVRGPFATRIGWSGSVTESPYAFQSVTAGVTRGFHNQSTVVGISGTYLSQKAPESFFIGTDLIPRKRPTRVTGLEGIVSVEQTLSSRWKVLAKIALAHRVQERPKHVRASLEQGFAITGRWFVEAEISHARELRSDDLRDERGYFGNTGVRLRTTVEPIYDLLLSASYGILVEREDDPRTGRRVRVAADQYGLGLLVRIARAELDFQGAFLRANTGVQSFGVSGGVKWAL